MIVEQAFISLPELLLGNHYAVQDNESGIVGLLSLAIFQELNGRNIPHPISRLQPERRYRPGSNRRVDLFVDVSQLMIANQSLANYGWRHHNWIEAKFYRNKSNKQRHATTKSTLQGQMIADLLRLTCLVPLEKQNDTNGRYFLHVYDDEPQYYLAYQDRPWVCSLHEAGRQQLVINQLSEESSTAKDQFGPHLQDIQIQATVTNLVNFPITTSDSAKQFWCVLTRFDSFSVTLDNRSFWIHANRVVRESSEGANNQLAERVASQLGSTKSSEISA